MCVREGFSLHKKILKMEKKEDLKMRLGSIRCTTSFGTVQLVFVQLEFEQIILVQFCTINIFTTVFVQLVF